MTTTIRTRADGLTVERVVFRLRGGYVPGLVERVLDGQFGLADLGSTVPLGTAIQVPDPREDPATVIAPVRLTD